MGDRGRQEAGDRASGDRYQFSPMTRTDLPLLRRWLATPEVTRWWGEPEEQLALVRDDLAEPAMAQFIVHCDGRPFGYLQCYDLAVWCDPAFGVQPRGTRGIDQFIGEPDMLGRGHGTALIRRFLTMRFTDGTPRIVTDPDPGNLRAIRCYEKAGFLRDRVVETHGGPALLMVCEQ